MSDRQPRNGTASQPRSFLRGPSVSALFRAARLAPPSPLGLALTFFSAPRLHDGAINRLMKLPERDHAFLQKT